MQIYEPLEDSYLILESFEKFLDSLKNKKISILDMGAGAGIISKSGLKKGYQNTLAVDINKSAVRLLKKQKINAIHSNLFNRIKRENKFGLIVFNPPYLPKDKYDNEPDTTGGVYGYEIILRFLKDARSHLEKDGHIILLISSFSKPKIVLKKAKQLGYSCSLFNKKNLFFERLFVYILKFK
jgi:release factor glutamine methyltransferase